MGIVRNQIKNIEGVDHLKNRLLRPDRTKPVVVISTPFHSDISKFNLDALDEVDGRCELYIIEDSDFTRALSERLQQGASVYNGACRVYPTGFTLHFDPSSLPLRYLQNTGDIDRLVADVWANADISEYRAQRIEKSVPATGVVASLFGSRALVKLSDGGVATIRQELSFPGVPLEWIFKPNTQVTGLWDRIEGLFIPDGSERSIKDVVDAIGIGNITLALVTEAGRQTGKVKLLPNLEIEISREEISHNDRDLVEDLLDVGDVVPVRLYRHAEGSIRTRMDDIDDDETLYPALPLVKGGEPWLREGRSIPDNSESAAIPIKIEDDIEPMGLSDMETALEFESPKPKLTGLAAVAAAISSKPQSERDDISNSSVNPSLVQWEAAQYREQVRQARLQIESLKKQRNEYHQLWVEASRELLDEKAKKKTATRAGKAEKRASGRTSSTTWSRRERFDNDTEWFNEEVRRAWIGRYMPTDRRKYVLDPSKFGYSAHFFQSLREVVPDEEGIRKAVRVILDIVTGRENDEHRYEIHDLRDGERSAPEARTRADGAEAKRAYLEQNTPQARRLHFWRLGNNTIEISRVAKHDDFRS